MGDVVFIKGGISNDPESRFTRWSSNINSMDRHKNHSTVVVHRAFFDIGRDAIELERALLSEESIREPQISGMDGGTELFSQDPLLHAMNVWNYEVNLVV